MKIICIGRNYIRHAQELNHEIPDKPVFFLKPDTALVKNNKPFFYPDFSKEIHHEIELVIQINRLGKNIDEKFAHRYYDKIGLGIDFTARDLQREHINKGLPWEISKAFDYSAPISEFVAINNYKEKGNIEFCLKINNQIVQKGNTKDMIFSFDEVISYVSHFMTLKIGDLIFTGTPEGVDPVKIGDHLQAFLEDDILMDFYIK
ncbi:MAG: fumarylacetoacetate hydrolase family protein [Bacteroidales bacterium]|nr:fumarylacetoacetate hydrolase family protein [Bacteroidales bacterium]